MSAKPLDAAKGTNVARPARIAYGVFTRRTMLLVLLGGLAFFGIEAEEKFACGRSRQGAWDKRVLRRSLGLPQRQRSLQRLERVMMPFPGKEEAFQLVCGERGNAPDLWYLLGISSTGSNVSPVNKERRQT